MDELNAIGEIAEVCLEAHALIDLHGTHEMRTLIRILLFQVGEEIVRQRNERGEKLDS